MAAIVCEIAGGEWARGESNSIVSAAHVFLRWEVFSVHSKGQKSKELDAKSKLLE